MKKTNLIKTLVAFFGSAFLLGNVAAVYASQTDYVANSPDKEYKDSLVNHHDSATVQAEKSLKPAEKNK